MFTDGVLERIFSRPELHSVPVGYQSTIIHAIEEALEDILEENPRVTIRQILSKWLVYNYYWQREGRN